MKEELPKIFANKIDKKLNNSQDIYYENHTTRNSKDIISVDKKINDIFNSPNFIYKSRVKITIGDKIYNKIIVGKKDNYLLTMDNESINITDIQDIETI